MPSPFRTWPDRSQLHQESSSRGSEYRAKYLDELNLLMRRQEARARKERERAFQPDFSSEGAYRKSLASYRRKYRSMLGWPLTDPSLRCGTPKPAIEEVASDALGQILRLRVPILPGLKMYGMLFLPNRKSKIGNRKSPLAICQHGGLGTPEQIAGLVDSANYNHMLRRVQARGVMVFAPQLLMWAPEFGPRLQRMQTDRFLKAIGGSITALEIHGIRRCLDYLVTRPDVDARRVGMLGLSYGGFFTLYTAAADTRIKVALASCSFCQRVPGRKPDWNWGNSANQFMDAEVAGLVCPRPLFIEAGRKDELVPAKLARAEATRARRCYKKLGLEKRFRFRVHDGGHEFAQDDKGVSFFIASLSSSL